jgi:hypothetical protein
MTTNFCLLLAGKNFDGEMIVFLQRFVSKCVHIVLPSQVLFVHRVPMCKERFVSTVMWKDIMKMRCMHSFQNDAKRTMNFFRLTADTTVGEWMIMFLLLQSWIPHYIFAVILRILCVCRGVCFLLEYTFAGRFCSD